MNRVTLAAIPGKLRALAVEIEQAIDDSPEALEVMDRSCSSKRRYSTAEAAGQAAASRGVDGLRVYPCGFCGSFHLTKATLEDFALGQR